MIMLDKINFFIMEFNCNLCKSCWCFVFVSVYCFVGIVDLCYCDGSC